MSDLTALPIITRYQVADKPLLTVAQIAAEPGGVRLLLARRRQLLDQGEVDGGNAIGEELLLALEHQPQPLPRWRRRLLSLVEAVR